MKNYFTLDYDYSGSKWSLPIGNAINEDDAESRLKAIKENGVIFGPVERVESNSPPKPEYGNGLLWEKI